MKFYKYIIYKLYKWGSRKEGDTPIANVILTLTIVHFIQLISVLMVILKLFSDINIFDLNKIFVGILFISFSVLHYFIIYDKNRWNNYIKEFEGESKIERKKGSVFVLSYLIGSILLFFLLLPLLYGF